MRYTEVRMSKLASEMLADIEKDTVNFIPNYDESLTMPEVLPARFPNLLVNGSSGIAVGMATNIPPHNLAEVCDAVSYLIEHPNAIAGPDHEDSFPARTSRPAGYIFNREGMRDAYSNGRGSIQIRAKSMIERGDKGERERIVVTEIPYAVNKSRLLESIAELVNEKKIEGIADIRDESDREGIRVVIEVKRGELPEVVLNNLYKHTQLQTSFGIIMLAIVDKQPKVLGLIDMMKYFVAHRQDVIRRRTRLRPEEGRSPGPHPGRADHRPGPPGRHHQAHPRLEERRRGPDRPDGEVQAVPDPGPGHPGDAAAAADQPGAGEDRPGVPGGQGPHRQAAQDPVSRQDGHGHHRPGAGRGQNRLPATPAAPSFAKRSSATCGRRT